MVPVYSVSSNVASLNEGSAVTYTISTQYVLDGTVLYWTTSGTTTSSDFSDGLTSGSVTMTNGTATVVRTLTNDIITEGSETIVFELRTGSTSGTIVASSPSVTVYDTSVLFITPSVSSVNEGSSVTWTINAVGFGTGTLYYTNSGTTSASDFSDGLNSGSIAITSDAGTLTKTLLNDLSTEGSETIIIQIRTGSTAGTVVGTSNTVTVADTSYSSQGYSVSLPSGANYINIATTNSNFVFTGDFTIEAWVNMPTTATGGPYTIFGSNYSGGGSAVFDFRYYNNNWQISLNGGFGTDISGTSGSITPNVWYHVAAVRSGSTITVYVNGKALGTTTNSNTLGYNQAYAIGSSGSGSGSNRFIGYISNLRVVNGTAVYTANFNPPTDNLSAIANTKLLINGATIADASGNNTLTTTGTPIVRMENPFGNNSILLNGSSQYLTIPSNAIFALPGDFTIEGWYYFNAAPGTTSGGFAALDQAGSGGVGFCFFTTTVNLFASNVGDQAVFTYTWPTSIWFHLAIVRSGTTVNCYVNGVPLTPVTGVSYSWVQSGIVTIGKNGGVSNTYLNGYISNFRIVKGTTLYPWIPSTTALTTTSQNATASQVSLLTAQSATIVDNGNGGPGQPTYITGTPYITLLNGTSQYITTPTNAALSFTGDFTVEGWFYFKSVTQGTLFHIGTETTNRFVFFLSSGGIQGNWYTGVSLSLGGSLSVGIWYHIAFTRTSGTIICYINGTATGSTIGQGGTLGDGKFSIGYEPTNSGSPYLSAYVTNVRAVNGIVVYTGAFTPSGPLTATQSSGTNIAAITGTSTSLLTLQDATFIDNSTNAFTITASGSPTPTNQTSNLPITNTGTVTAGNSVIPFASTYSYQFNGSSQYLNLIGTNSTLAFGTGDFTIETWIYLTSVPSYVEVIDFRPSGTLSGVYPNLYLSSGSLRYYVSGVDRITGATLSTSTWYHVAVVKLSGSTRLFVNGSQSGSTYTDSNSYLNGTDRPIIGASGYDLTGKFPGYISNMRIVKGTALYSSNFTLSTAALTAITNTTLLTFQYPELYDASTNKLAITNNGTALISSQNPFGNYHASFDGSSQYLSIPYNSAWSIPAGGAFCMEAWIYVKSGIAGPEIMAFNHNSGSSVGSWAFWLENSINPQLAVPSGTSQGGTYYYFNRSFYSGISYNTWTHVAITRDSSGAGRAFINGMLNSYYYDSPTTGSGRAFTGTSGSLFIGTASNQVSYSFFSGYMTNVRFVNGSVPSAYATSATTLGTQAFTPSTTPLTAVSNTAILTCQYSEIVDSSINTSTITNSGSIKTYLTDAFSGIVSGVNYAQKNYSLKLIPSSVAVTYLSGTLPATLSGDFTIECWFYMDYTLGSPPTLDGSTIAGTGATVGGAFTIAGNGSTSSTGWMLTVCLDGLGWARPGFAQNFEFVPSGATYGSRYFQENTWYHLAVSRSGTTWYCFVNGVLATNRTASNYSITTTAFTIGDMFAQTQWNFWGYISNLRIVNGTAVYTSAFTPSTTPLKPITNTSLLTCQYNTLFDNSTNKLSLTRTGSLDMVNVYPFPV
jgi:hypothetical protein